MKYILTPLLLLCALLCYSQTVTHGPIVGAVTDSSCRVFVRTSAPVTCTIELSNSSTFSFITASAIATTDALTDNTAIAEVDGLNPNAKYYLRININGTPSGNVAVFETFYAGGANAHQVFLTGAGIGSLTDNDSAIFVHARNENAKAFINLGNWGYPDATTGCADVYEVTPPTSWAKTYSNVQNLYKQRYAGINALPFLQSLGTDYIYDDHDYMNEKAGKTEVLGYHINLTNSIYGGPAPWSQPAQARLNSILGYRQYFPAYNLPDTEGIYHSFRSGNAEFFVLDTRSIRGPELQSVDTQGTSNHWVYHQPVNSSILGTNQMAWLKNALAGSTATWKFIVSSVPFNIANRLVVDTLMKLGSTTVPYWYAQLSCFPLLGKQAFAATNHFSDWWAGNRNDGDTLLQYILSNNIPNVYVLSGNSNTVGMDDGVNAGLPELMCANMKQVNSQDALNIRKFMGFNIWDLGGSGLCGQSNFNTTYGRVEVYNNDSIRLSAIDASGSEVAGANFYANTPYKYTPNYSPYRIPVAVNDRDSVIQGDSVKINVIANDKNIQPNALFVNLLTAPAHGTALINTDNTITYKPDSAYFGADTFTYTACNHENAICQDCSPATVIIAVAEVVNSIRPIENNIPVSVYPNPAEHTLYITVANAQVYRITLNNMLGQPVMQSDFSVKLSWDISHLAPGNYTYYIYSKDQQQRKSGKIIIVR